MIAFWPVLFSPLYVKCLYFYLAYWPQTCCLCPRKVDIRLPLKLEAKFQMMLMEEECSLYAWIPGMCSKAELHDSEERVRAMGNMTIEETHFQKLIWTCSTYLMVISVLDHVLYDPLSAQLSSLQSVQRQNSIKVNLHTNFPDPSGAALWYDSWGKAQQLLFLHFLIKFIILFLISCKNFLKLFPIGFLLLYLTYAAPFWRLFYISPYPIILL